MKVAILGRQNPLFFREVMKANIENAGFRADIVDMESRNFLDFAHELKDYDAIITCGEKLPTAAVKTLGTGNVKLLSRWGVGTDEIDKEEAARQGIAVCNAANSLSIAVAECAIGMMINLLREFPARDASVRRNDWSWFFEGMLTGFDCRVVACDEYYWDAEAAQRYNVEQMPREEIIRTADVVSLHLAATEDTYNMVNREFLIKMKNSAILINTARGALVDEDALVWALENGEIAAAGLDVFQKEPPDPDNKLLTLDNVMLLPHSGAGSYECLEKSSAMASGNVIDFFQGKTVKTILNPRYAENLT